MKIEMEKYRNHCATCKLVTLDRDENMVCYATCKEICKNRECDCNAYEFSGELKKWLLK